MGMIALSSERTFREEEEVQIEQHEDTPLNSNKHRLVLFPPDGAILIKRHTTWVF